MNPYATLAQTVRSEEVRRLIQALSAWHDEMVLHQRVVQRLGSRAVCSEDCPHARGRRLWQEAKSLLGRSADDLAFLRSCAATRPGPVAGPVVDPGSPRERRA